MYINKDIIVDTILPNDTQGSLLSYIYENCDLEYIFDNISDNDKKEFMISYNESECEEEIIDNIYRNNITISDINFTTNTIDLSEEEINDILSDLFYNSLNNFDFFKEAVEYFEYDLLSEIIEQLLDEEDEEFISIIENLKTEIILN